MEILFSYRVHFLSFLVLTPEALVTFTTIFCSSIKKARRILSLTHWWQRTPPYALVTVFFLLDMRERSIGLAGVMPLSFSLHCPHLGTRLGFFRYW